MMKTPENSLWIVRWSLFWITYFTSDLADWFHIMKKKKTAYFLDLFQHIPGIKPFVAILYFSYPNFPGLVSLYFPTNRQNGHLFEKTVLQKLYLVWKYCFIWRDDHSVSEFSINYAIMNGFHQLTTISVVLDTNIHLGHAGVPPQLALIIVVQPIGTTNGPRPRGVVSVVGAV